MPTPDGRPTIPEVVDDFVRYHDREPVWGSMHIVLDDDNVEDSSVQFCIDFAKEKGDVEGERLARILLTMSRTQRLRLPNVVYERIKRRSLAAQPTKGENDG
jgi:hypothetical protein